jgi:hypothetical protein
MMPTTGPNEEGLTMFSMSRIVIIGATGTVGRQVEFN